MFISFSQNLEDVMLWRALQHVANGFYIDVGAAHPTILSVTRHFYDRGWNGLNIEPHPGYYDLLSRERPRDISVRLGVGNAEGHFTYYEVDNNDLSTFNAEVADTHRKSGHQITEHVTQVTTLAALCAQYRMNKPIHFLKIDAEGFEKSVLEGADFQTFRPWIVLVEATVPLSGTTNYHLWDGILTGQDYVFAWFDGLNRFYIAREHWDMLGHHFHVQPNVFDPFVPASGLLQHVMTIQNQLQMMQDQAIENTARIQELEKQLQASSNNLS